MVSSNNKHVLVCPPAYVPDCTWDPRSHNLHPLYRLIETNIAIIVGCMPAFAQVVTVHILGSQFFKSMHTRLLGSSGRRGKSSKTRVASNEQLPEIVTFGANQGRRKYNEPWELTDTALLRTNATVMGDEEDFGQRSKPSSSYSATAHV